MAGENVVKVAVCRTTSDIKRGSEQRQRQDRQQVQLAVADAKSRMLRFSLE